MNWDYKLDPPDDGQYEREQAAFIRAEASDINDWLNITVSLDTRANARELDSPWRMCHLAVVEWLRGQYPTFTTKDRLDA